MPVNTSNIPLTSALNLKLRREFIPSGEPGYRYVFRYILIYEGKSVFDTLTDVAEYYKTPFKTVEREFYKTLTRNHMEHKDIEEMIKWTQNYIATKSSIK